MSWFTDLAGKAEDFLNKMDQGAATALTKTQDRSSPYGGELPIPAEVYKADSSADHSRPENKASYISAAAGNIKKSNTTLLAGTSNTAAFSSGSSGGAQTSAKVSSGFVRPHKDQDLDDDMLFDFLNSSDPLASTRRDSRRELVKVPVAESKSTTPPPLPANTPYNIPSAPSTPPSTRGVSRASSMSSLSALSVKTSEDNSAKEQSQGTNHRLPLFSCASTAKRDYILVSWIFLFCYQKYLSLSMCRLTCDYVPSCLSLMPTTDTPESSDSGLAVPQESSRQESSPPPPPPPAAATPSTEEPQSHILSSLRLENQLLRSEVSSLNQEMASVIERAKDLQEGKHRVMKKKTKHLYSTPSL